MLFYASWACLHREAHQTEQGFSNEVKGSAWILTLLDIASPASLVSPSLVLKEWDGQWAKPTPELTQGLPGSSWDRKHGLSVAAWKRLQMFWSVKTTLKYISHSQNLQVESVKIQASALKNREDQELPLLEWDSQGRLQGRNPDVSSPTLKYEIWQYLRQNIWTNFWNLPQVFTP